MSPSTQSAPNRAQRRQADKMRRAAAAHKPAKRSRLPAVLNAPGMLLAYGQAEHTPAEAASLTVAKRLAFERIRSGAAIESAPGLPGPSDSHEMAELVNLLVLLSERVTDATAREHIEATGKAAQAAVLSAQARMQAHGRFGFDGPGAAAITEALDVYEQLLPLIKPAHLAQALATMLQRQQQGHIFRVTQ